MIILLHPRKMMCVTSQEDKRSAVLTRRSRSCKMQQSPVLHDERWRLERIQMSVLEFASGRLGL